MNCRESFGPFDVWFALLLIACALLALVLFGRIPSNANWAADLANFAHGPVFAVLTLILVALLRRGPTQTLHAGLEYAVAFALVLLLGLSIEAVQSTIGRDAEIGDLLRDGLGALVALGFLATIDPKLRAALPRRRWRIGAALIGITGTALLLAPLVIAAQAYLERQLNFPVLADFDRPSSTYFVNDLGGASSRRELLPHMSAAQTEAEYALLVTAQTSTWWGIALREPLADWQRYSSLAITIENPTDRILRLQLRIQDMRGSTDTSPQFVTGLEIAPLSLKTTVIPFGRLTAVGRKATLDIANVRSIVLAKSGQNLASRFYLVRMWLE